MSYSQDDSWHKGDTNCPTCGHNGAECNAAIKRIRHVESSDLHDDIVRLMKRMMAPPGAVDYGGTWVWHQDENGVVFVTQDGVQRLMMPRSAWDELTK